MHGRPPPGVHSRPDLDVHPLIVYQLMECALLCLIPGSVAENQA